MIMKEFSLEAIELIVKAMADTAVANEKYFSDLDGVVGDADFGVSLANGFQVVLNQWSSIDRSSIGSFLIKVSTIIMDNIKQTRLDIHLQFFSNLDIICSCGICVMLITTPLERFVTGLYYILIIGS